MMPVHCPLLYFCPHFLYFDFPSPFRFPEKSVPWWMVDTFRFRVCFFVYFQLLNKCVFECFERIVMGAFNYNHDEEVTHVAYYRSYEEIFKGDCISQSDERNVRLFLRKFDPTENKKNTSLKSSRKHRVNCCLKKLLFC